MYLATSLFVAGLAGLAQAQSVTPAGFTPAAMNKLDVYFNTTIVRIPGQVLPKADVAAQPKLAVSTAMANMTETYMFVMLDLDVPPADGTTKRRVLLHAMNTGFKATQQRIGGGSTLLATSDKGPAAYISPGPPPTDTIPHRYVELLFQQPADLAVQESDFANTAARINFDIEAFMTKNRVSAPVAGNFFMVDGKASATAKGTASASGSGGMPGRTPEPFTGSAEKYGLSPGMAGLIGGLALLAI
ncbi:phosphatidylethanolamine-binding protein [Boeremia exigua]|uniref:phosphatidylethanolamine-binding protein n=1 Tax=Boeremia exigua TaxID=749465 RepID=UPI001E8DD68B|nr:phosphatidylethanolamine-binding protein [Boeremia exigua]KAH6638935.1 phosphatidylethanolamine-binding protein [Boeremia exigua]